ncbi:hypothetical protein [Haladaptatus salinisoli]|uniref:hypothetical protein n=1 Tax=Haladaptatus salinisoli TaxID=2884876 RepID=UPI001D0B7146|nr:hypothetical protein [Haladaptatus salinisoli]
MVVFESTLAGLLLAGIGVTAVTRPREIFTVRQSVSVVPSRDFGEFGVARYQVYGLVCLLVGLVLVLASLFLP